MPFTTSLGDGLLEEQKKIQRHVGYLPGELSFPDDMTGLLT